MTAGSCSGSSVIALHAQLRLVPAAARPHVPKSASLVQGGVTLTLLHRSDSNVCCATLPGWHASVRHFAQGVLNSSNIDQPAWCLQQVHIFHINNAAARCQRQDFSCVGAHGGHATQWHANGVAIVPEVEAVWNVPLESAQICTGAPNLETWMPTLLDTRSTSQQVAVNGHASWHAELLLRTAPCGRHTVTLRPNMTTRLLASDMLVRAYQSASPRSLPSKPTVSSRLAIRPVGCV